MVIRMDATSEVAIRAFKPSITVHIHFASDDTGEEDQRLSREIALKDRSLAEKDKQLALRDQQLADKNRELADKNKQLSESERASKGSKINWREVTECLAAKDQELEQLRRNDPGSSSRAGDTSGGAPGQADDTIRDRDSELLERQTRRLDEGPEDDTSKQQREIAELREMVMNLQAWRKFGCKMSRNIVQPNNMV
ncbi:hypothetical protein FRC10_004809 [Ceratobasidium sp. 414]|nr:hypothetical protein FRC10_004809 [Ceratobasidium sp. 414]